MSRKALDAHQACHCSHHHPADSGEEPDSPQDCDEANCVFVASKHSDSHIISWMSLTSLAALSSTLELGDQEVGFIRLALEDVPHLEGPALRVWQCVWVI